LHIGCRTNRSATAERPDVARLTELTKLYANYLRTNRNQAPASEADFKAIVAEAGGSILKRAGVSSVDELFVSPRDGQPFVVLYGKDAARLIRRGVIAHERIGKDGRRLVGYELGYVHEVGQEEFAKLVPTR
jgi:hypothetical protein